MMGSVRSTILWGLACLLGVMTLSSCAADDTIVLGDTLAEREAAAELEAAELAKLDLPPEEQGEFFRFELHDTVVFEDVKEVHEALLRERVGIQEVMQIAQMSRITVSVWNDYERFLFDGGYDGSNGHVTSPTDLSIFLGDVPSNPNTSAPPQTAVHEFAHLVTMARNSSIANDPRWLWEAVVMYVTDDFIPLNSYPELEEDAVTLESLNELEFDGVNIYVVGYVLIQYIVDKWGFDKVLELIDNNGDIEETLDVYLAEFEWEWHLWLVENYF